MREFRFGRNSKWPSAWRLVVYPTQSEMQAALELACGGKLDECVGAVMRHAAVGKTDRRIVCYMNLQLATENVVVHESGHVAVSMFRNAPMEAGSRTEERFCVALENIAVSIRECIRQVRHEMSCLE